MKNLKDIILEKLVINKHTKVYITKLSDREQNKIIDELSQYFQGSGSYHGKEYENRLQIVDKFFDNDIYEYINKYDIWEDFAEWMHIDDAEEFKNYIKHNKEELYQTICNNL